MATNNNSIAKFTKKNGILAWHFLPDNGKTANGEGKLIKAGGTVKVTGPVSLCSHGYHASVRAIDALQYAPGTVVQRVIMWGEVEHGDDKLVASNRTCLWVADATRTLHEFACWCADQALELMRSRGVAVDPRSENAIAVKRQWLDGQASDSELAAAWAAARGAARDAARDAAWAAAWDAARGAARGAARAAAWAAAWDAAWDAARAAAWDAARDDQNTKLEAMLATLELVPTI